MASIIQVITRMAIQHFNRDVHRPLSLMNADLDHIKKLVNALTAADVCIEPKLLEDRGPYDPSNGEAPVTYMPIYEDKDVTICVFILKNGVRLPLHDHPNMTGILKVLHGRVSLQSYSMAESMRACIGGVFPAVKHPLVEVGANDDACVLLPDKSNLHEIVSVGGPSAFLDILAPPYNHDDPINIRICHYYEELKTQESSQKQTEDSTAMLMCIHSPDEFWCDQVHYRGPSPLGANFRNGKS